MRKFLVNVNGTSYEITVEEIDQYEFCPADVEILTRLKEARETI